MSLEMKSNKSTPRNETKIYKTWYRMMGRCYRTKTKGYETNGGAGIKVAARWHDFNNFLEDMGEVPGEGFCFIRTDKNKDYCKENCEWKLSTENGTHSSLTWIIIYNGESLSVNGWAKKIGISPITLKKRLVNGCTIEEAFTLPTVKTYEYKGESHTLSEWSTILKIDRATLSGRLGRGWSIKRAFSEPVKQSEPRWDSSHWWSRD